MTIARTKTPPKTYVLRVLAETAQKLSREERQAIVDGYASGVAAEYIGDLILACRALGIKPIRKAVIEILRERIERERSTP